MQCLLNQAEMFLSDVVAVGGMSKIIAGYHAAMLLSDLRRPVD
jgi:hypothetical protein